MVECCLLLKDLLMTIIDSKILLQEFVIIVCGIPARMFYSIAVHLDLKSFKTTTTDKLINYYNNSRCTYK